MNNSIVPQNPRGGVLHKYAHTFTSIEEKKSFVQAGVEAWCQRHYYFVWENTICTLPQLDSIIKSYHFRNTLPCTIHWEIIITPNESWQWQKPDWDVQHEPSEPGKLKKLFTKLIGG